MQSETVGVAGQRTMESDQDDSPGIIVFDGGRVGGPRPRIAAFIWGGKVKPVATLPFGRWKGAA